MDSGARRSIDWQAKLVLTAKSHKLIKGGLQLGMELLRLPWLNAERPAASSSEFDFRSEGMAYDTKLRYIMKRNCTF